MRQFIWMTKAIVSIATIVMIFTGLDGGLETMIVSGIIALVGCGILLVFDTDDHIPTIKPHVVKEDPPVSNEIDTSFAVALIAISQLSTKDLIKLKEIIDQRIEFTNITERLNKPLKSSL